ncbi:MAG: YihY/virulence factor BrkB family protein [Muribaculaceae bacterium]|nr:YihY/virulence factor BrkB family protein [Muribaculaceae bacterium]MDE6521539.1 YihY/virulence factor BrkB family protein [Muribaculaceae bacterium]
MSEITDNKKAKKPGFIDRLIEKAEKWYNYCVSGVWSDPRKTMKVRLIKTINLTVQAFLNRDLQIKSMAITYQTVFAMVPALALLLAISKGFGFQEIVEKELYTYFPSQSKALGAALGFVDSYLAEASSGILVGVGLIVLLWTLISLLSNIEDAFNNIWDIKTGRNTIQKIKDYIAIFLLIPVLMILSSGISIFMSSTVLAVIPFAFMTPMINALMELLPVVLTWGAFTLCFWLIPNTKVEFKYAAISGAFCAVAFEVLQLLFLNGQIYVSKYNAIYGSFAFLPLMLIWLQLSWLLLLSGCGLTYSLQNVFSYNFFGNLTSVAESYFREVLLVVTAVIYRRFHLGMPAPTRNKLSMTYGLPIRLVSNIADKLERAGLVQIIESRDGKDDPGLIPTTDTDKIMVKDVVARVESAGMKDFIPEFNTTYKQALTELNSISEKMYEAAGNMLIRDLDIFVDIDNPNPPTT